ncbi:hypothetical protein [Micromonospora sp. KC213]|uniref:hypothetical protein n=1 Tax=Micromonospora sp. KC213 TaxID=2530378 RepID=UPI0014048954|nr:hypothetical protein [Micromonospora sp. KC213]
MAVILRIIASLVMLWHGIDTPDTSVSVVRRRTQSLAIEVPTYPHCNQVAGQVRLGAA